jgi:hypothetical protein
MKKNAANRTKGRDTGTSASELSGTTLTRVRGGSNGRESRSDPRPQQVSITDSSGWD